MTDGDECCGENTKQERGNDETSLVKIGCSEKTSLRRAFEQRSEKVEEAMQMSERRAFQAKTTASVDKECLMHESSVRFGVLAVGWAKEEGELVWNAVKDKGVFRHCMYFDLTFGWGRWEGIREF